MKTLSDSEDNANRIKDIEEETNLQAEAVTEAVTENKGSAMDNIPSPQLQGVDLSHERPKKRQKIALACDTCRLRKVKCDGALPGTWLLKNVIIHTLMTQYLS